MTRRKIDSEVLAGYKGSAMRHVEHGLSRVKEHRAPATADFFAALRGWYGLPETADPAVEAPALRRFRLAEFRLYLALGAPPAWYREFPWLDHATVAQNGFWFPSGCERPSPRCGVEHDAWPW